MHMERVMDGKTTNPMLVASAGSVACQCLLDAAAVLSLKAFSSVHCLVSGGKLAIEIDKNV